MMADENRTLLKVDNLCFSYKAKHDSRLNIVHDVSFEIEKGEFLCLLGPSGCGKTTLLRLISRLETQNSGEIETYYHKHDDFRVGMVFQDLALFPHMSAARNVGYALRHLSRQKRRERTNEMLDLVGLLHKRGAYPHELSGGQKQRLALARALARHPDLILLDEPFASQDITLRARMRDDVMHILRKAGVAAILVTHDPEEAMHFADRIAIMNEGCIQQIGTPAEIYNHPQSAFVASFFGQVNILNGEVEDEKVLTPVGTISAPNFQDNTNVQIIIRPEALRLSSQKSSENSIHCHVLETSYLGRSTMIHFDMDNISDNNNVLHLHARVPGELPASENDQYYISLENTQIFIFAK
ncbi:MAG: ABC transporter ATP-binding protein [Neptuniibacter sp.]